MTEINNLVYFLNSIKDILPFEDEKDFAKKINESKDFRIKIQKVVYISKYFGWNNPFIFTLAKRGPYSIELKQAYSTQNLFDNTPEEIKGLDLSAIRDFITDKSLLFIEATATILYQFKDYSSKEECINSIYSLKSYISPDTINDAYNSIKNFKIYDNKINITEKEVTRLKNQVNTKINELTEYFEKFEGSRNRTIILGSIDYMRIAFRESNLHLEDTFYLLIFIKRYLFIIEKISKQITSDELINLNLNDLEDIFEQFQEFVSEEHHIIKKIDDDDFDEKLCYY